MNKLKVIFVILAFSVIGTICFLTDLFMEMYVVMFMFPFIIGDLKRAWKVKSWKPKN